MQPDPLALIDASLGAALVALLAVVGLLALRDARHLILGRMLALLCLSLCSLALLAHPVTAPAPTVVLFVLAILAAPNVGLIWAIGVALLTDSDQRHAVWRILTVGLLSIAPLVFGLARSGQMTGLATAIAPYGIIPVVLAGAHLCWVAVSEYRSDLIETRRKARFLLVFVLAVATLLSILSEDIADPRYQAIWRNGAIGLPLGLLLLLWLVRLQPHRLAFAPPFAQGHASQPVIDPRDRYLVDQINHAMTIEMLFLDPDISIERLAVRFDVPPHRLRATINRVMGHRNFATFVNGYRIKWAKSALADPARGRDTILEIGFESGFSSLQTFNRVFREIAGMNPTEYRRDQLAALSTNGNV